MAVSIGITGYSGFIGKSLLPVLVDDDKISKIYLLGRRDANQKETKTRWIKFDLENPSNNEDLELDVLVHVAGKFQKKTVDAESKEYFLTNVFGTYNLLTTFRPKHLIYVSTVDVYGVTSKVITEELQANPANYYSMSKYLGEQIANLVLGNSRVTVLRLGNVYGENDYSSKLIPLAFKKLTAKEKITIFGKGDYTRDYIYISDVVNIVKSFILKAKPGLYNVVTGESTRVKDVVKYIIDLYKVGEDNIELVPSDIQQISIKFDNSKLLSALGAYKFVKLDDGLRKIYDNRQIIF
ncbi:MAG: NAD(P)-dependent oxidoreductase [Thermoplasmatales archaeon]